MRDASVRLVCVQEWITGAFPTMIILDLETGGRVVIITDGTTSDRIPEASSRHKGEVYRGRRTPSTGVEKCTLGRP
jgi:hypothetical protein